MLLGLLALAAMIGWQQAEHYRWLAKFNADRAEFWMKQSDDWKHLACDFVTSPPHVAAHDSKDLPS